MILKREPYRPPRQGPSCLAIALIFAGIAGIIFGFLNREQVVDAIIPDPTPTATRSPVTYAAKAALHEEDGEFDEAITAYRAAVTLDPDRVEYYLPLVRLLVKANQPEEALELLDTAAELAPERGDLYALWANAWLANGYRWQDKADAVAAATSFEEAVTQANKAIDINPNDGMAYAVRGAALSNIDLQFLQQAIEAAATALELDKDNPDVRRHVAAVYENQGLYELAMEQYEAALVAEPRAADLFIGIARNHWAQQQLAAAIANFTRAIEYEPDNAAAYDGRGFMYFLLGDYNKAQEDFVIAVDLDPEMTRARAHLGGALFRSNNYDGENGAIAYLETAIEQYGSVTFANSTYFNMLGLAYFYTREECSDSLPIFESVLAVVPAESLAAQDARFGQDLCFGAQLSPP